MKERLEGDVGKVEDGAVGNFVYVVCICTGLYTISSPLVYDAIVFALKMSCG